MTFVTCDTALTDYRPAVGPIGAKMVFERTPHPKIPAAPPTRRCISRS
jgi:hypothetical protein